MSLAPRDATRLQECLAGDGLAVIPTDTVYGLACNPQSVTAVKRMHELKGRPTTKPSAVMFFAPAPALDALTNLGPRTRAAFKTLLPGPVTLLLPWPAGGTLGGAMGFGYLAHGAWHGALGERAADGASRRDAQGH